MIYSHKKQGGFSILAIILVIVAVVVAIGIWALSGNSNSENNSNATTDTLAAAIINDGALIKSKFDEYIISGYNGNNIIYKPGVASTALNPNILDPVNGLNLPVVSSKALQEGFSFPYGVWAYTNTYENNQLSIADAPGIAVLGLNEKTCKSINKILHGENRIPSTASTSNVIISGMTQTNPYLAYFNTEVENTEFPNLIGWKNGCLKSQDEIYMYFQSLVGQYWN